MSNATDVGLEDRLIGLTYMLMAGTGASLYVPCLIVLHRDQELNKHSCLRIMFHLGLCDMSHLSTCFIGGVLTFTGYAHTAPYWLNRILMSVTVVIGWYGYVTFAHILALGRCLVYTNKALEQRFFGPKATTRWLYVGWLITGAWMVLNLTNYGGFYYFGSLRCYHFDVGAHWLVKKIDWYNCLINQTSIVICNCISIWSVHELVVDASSTESQRMERRLVYQCILICSFLVFYDQFWHNGITILCPLLGPYCFPFGIVLCLINASMNPIVYLTINKTIKKKVRRMLGIGVVASNQVGTSNKNKPLPKRGIT